jgi:hypothetical protein
MYWKHGADPTAHVVVLARGLVLALIVGPALVVVLAQVVALVLVAAPVADETQWPIRSFRRKHSS